MFTDDELFAFADETVNTFYAERMSYICGTHFTSSSNFENYIKNDDGIYYEVDDSQVHRIMISKMFITRSFLEDIQSATISHTT